MKEVPAFCPVCGRQVLARRTPASNVLHLLLAVVTAGLWLIPWFFIATSSRAQTYFCTLCGTPLIGPLAGRGARQTRSARKERVREVKLVECVSCGHSNKAARRCVKCGADL